MQARDGIRYERELSEPVRRHLCDCGFEVRAEVNSCDIVGHKDGRIVVVELKRHLSFDLLAQAVERQAYSDLVYVCVPKPTDFRQDRAWRAKLSVLRQLGLGLLFVGGTVTHFTVEEVLAPGEGRVPRSSGRKRQALERELLNRKLDLNTGGSHAVPLVTAYRESALFLAHLLSLHGNLTAKQLRDLGGHERRTGPILRSNHYGWFGKNEDGSFALTGAGRQALVTYGPLVEVFKERAGAGPAGAGNPGPQ